MDEKSDIKFVTTRAILFILQLKSSYSIKFYVKRSFIYHLAHVIRKFGKVGKTTMLSALQCMKKSSIHLQNFLHFRLHFRLKKSMDLSGFIQKDKMDLSILPTLQFSSPILRTNANEREWTRNLEVRSRVIYE